MFTRKFTRYSLTIRTLQIALDDNDVAIRTEAVRCLLQLAAYRPRPCRWSLQMPQAGKAGECSHA
jgi:hypothetical protein